MRIISHSETSLLGKIYMHQENNALFMATNVNFAFFSCKLLGHSKKNNDFSIFQPLSLTWSFHGNIRENGLSWERLGVVFC